MTAAQDPLIGVETLCRPAYHYPKLRPAMTVHPHAYHGLLDWLYQFNDPRVNAVLKVHDNYDDYINSSGYPVTCGDVSDAVIGLSTRTSESGMYILGRGGANSYPQVECITPYFAAISTNAPIPQVGAHEQIVAQTQRQSIIGSGEAQDPEAIAVCPNASPDSSYPSASATPACPQCTPQVYPGVGASHQVQPTALQEAIPKGEKKRRGSPVMGLILGVLGLIAMIFPGFATYAFTHGYGGPAANSDTTSPASSSSPAHVTPSPNVAAEEPVRYSAPADAATVDSFSSPSGNITCSFTADGVNHDIRESDWIEDGYASCSGGNQVDVLTVSKGRAGQPREATVPGDGNAFAHGAAATEGDHAHRFTQDDINYQNTKTGQSFALACGGWVTDTTGEIGPQKFSWNG